MIHLIKAERNFHRKPLIKLWDSSGDQVLVFGREDLLFVFNFNPSRSFFDYGILAPKGRYVVVLNTDARDFGGYAIKDDSLDHFTQFDPFYEDEGKEWLKLYIPARTAFVLRRVE